MRYGLELPNAGPCGDARTLAEMAALAEAAGWDGVFLEDYIVHWTAPDIPTYDPWVALAAMALSTEHVRLGTTVTPLSRRRPWKLAREAATVDHLSGGRLILGVGLGDLNDPGFGAVGEVTGNHERAELLDEALDILAGLWSGAPFRYDGRHFHIEELVFQPGPVQQPRIPIWIGGNWPHLGPIRRAARWDGFVGGKEHGPNEDWHLTPAEIRLLKAEIERHRTSKAPYDLALGGGQRGPDLEVERAIVREAQAAGATWWMEYIPVSEPDVLREHIRRGPVRAEA